MLLGGSVAALVSAVAAFVVPTVDWGDVFAALVFEALVSAGEDDVSGGGDVVLSVVVSRKCSRQ